MNIGAQIGAAALAIALDLDLAILGIAVCMTVIMGAMILFNIGSGGVQRHVREWFMGVFWAFLLSGGAQMIGRGLQKVLTFG